MPSMGGGYHYVTIFNGREDAAKALWQMAQGTLYSSYSLPMAEVLVSPG